MNRKFICLLLLLSLLPALCIGCKRSASEDVLTDKSINVYYLDESQNTTVEAKFFGDIPYLSVETYVSLIYRGRNVPEGRDAVNVTVEGDVYTVTTAGGEPAVFNVTENTMETANFSMFKNTHFTEKGVEGCIAYDGLPFVKVESVTVDREAVPMKIDFDDYGIDVFGDGITVYLPIATLSDMFLCQNILVGAYNGKDLYVYYYSDGETVSLFDKQYLDDLYAAPRTEQLAEFNYGEFCLNYDHFLGRSGRSVLERFYDVSKGLDAALESDKFTKEVKRCLKSADIVEYLAGLKVYARLVSDGGHTVYDPYSTINYQDENGAGGYPEWFSLDMFAQIDPVANDVISLNVPMMMHEVCERYKHHGDVYKARHKAFDKPSRALNGRETYTLAGDTAIIHIDSFMGEFYSWDAWNDYYAGKTGEIPFDNTTGGAVCAVYFGLQQAQKDGVRRVIIDLSANTGGSIDELMYLLSLLTGHDELQMRDRTSGQIYTAKYRIDRNLDRVFDEKDDEFDLVGGLELAVISSQNGFFLRRHLSRTAS